MKFVMGVKKMMKDQLDDSYVQFVYLFKKEIAARGLTHKQVAEMLNTSEMNLHNWLYFKRQMMGEFVVKIIMLFGLKIE